MKHNYQLRIAEQAAQLAAQSRFASLAKQSQLHRRADRLQRAQQLRERSKVLGLSLRSANLAHTLKASRGRGKR